MACHSLVRMSPHCSCPLPTSTLHPPQPSRTGLTIWDVLALGALGHIIGVGIVLGLHNSGNL